MKVYNYEKNFDLLYTQNVVGQSGVMLCSLFPRYRIKKEIVLYEVNINFIHDHTTLLSFQ